MIDPAPSSLTKTRGRSSPRSYTCSISKTALSSQSTLPGTIVEVIANGSASPGTSLNSEDNASAAIMHSAAAVSILRLDSTFVGGHESRQQ
ncbi:hypothetical protein EV363DRAFT_1182841 [Boletus edulis]|nr:hypothetical protein EV363DRAFT_1182841 [Boletus edulis]